MRWRVHIEVVIYHNAACGAPRKVVAALREAGRESSVVDYQIIAAGPRKAR